MDTVDHPTLNTVMMTYAPIIALLISSVITPLVTHFVNSRKLALVQQNVEKIEKATNSMKDALVAATASASHAQGKADERSEQEARAALVAKGAAEGPR